jgi:hypothetical protein
MLHLQHIQSEVLFEKIMQAVTCRPAESAASDATTKALTGTNEDNNNTELILPTPCYRDQQEWFRTSSWFQYILGSLRYEVRKQRRNGKEGRNIVAKVQVPRWISNLVWECRGNEEATSWRFTFQAYRIVPWNSPLFKFAENGNVEGIQELLSSHQALVNDRADFQGRTALHVS